MNIVIMASSKKALIYLGIAVSPAALNMVKTSSRIKMQMQIKKRYHGFMKAFLLGVLKRVINSNTKITTSAKL